MDAIKEFLRVVDKLEHGEINIDEYEKLCEPLRDVRENVQGEWIPIDVGDCCYRCSVCNFVRDAYLLEEDNYCPKCGAEMRGENK